MSVTLAAGEPVTEEEVTLEDLVSTLTVFIDILDCNINTHVLECICLGIPPLAESYANIMSYEYSKHNLGTLVILTLNDITISYTT